MSDIFWKESTNHSLISHSKIEKPQNFRFDSNYFRLVRFFKRKTKQQYLKSALIEFGNKTIKFGEKRPKNPLLERIYMFSELHYCEILMI